MKIMFSVGEASGDLHGAVLAAAIRKIVPEAELFGMGGIKMKQAGVRIVYDIENLGVIGIGEVIRKIPFFLHLRQYLLTVMKKERPDVLVCVDYPGFNMRLAKKAKGLGIPVIYFLLKRSCINKSARRRYMPVILCWIRCGRRCLKKKCINKWG